MFTSWWLTVYSLFSGISTLCVMLAVRLLYRLNVLFSLSSFGLLLTSYSYTIDHSEDNYSMYVCTCEQ